MRTKCACDYHYYSYVRCRLSVDACHMLVLLDTPAFAIFEYAMLLLRSRRVYAGAILITLAQKRYVYAIHAVFRRHIACGRVPP